MASSISNVLFAVGAEEVLLDNDVLLVPGTEGGGDSLDGEFLNDDSLYGDPSGEPILLPFDLGLGERMPELDADVAVADELEATGDLCN